MVKNNYGNRYEILELVFYILIAFISVYFLPSIISKTLFLSSLILVWITKRDYFWFAFFFILANEPGGFFSGGLASDEHRLPIYTLGGGVSFTITELYLLIAFTKTYFNRTFKNLKPFVFFKKELIIIFFLFIFLVLISPLLGMSVTSLRDTYKVAIHLTLFRMIFYFFLQEKDLANFLRLLFPFVSVAIAMQIYGLTIGMPPVELFKPGSVLNLYGDVTTEFRRPIEMAMLLLVTYGGVLYFKVSRTFYFNSSYLDLVLGASFLSILITGTRTWFVAFVIGYIYYILFVKRIRITKSSFSFFAAIIAFSIIMLNVATIENQLYNSWSRLITIGDLAEGDMTMGGTAVRYTDSAPAVLQAFSESTLLFGAAFSDLYYSHGNIHVGYHNILLNLGFIGTIIFVFILFKIIRTVRKSNNKALKASLIPLLLLLIINSGVQVIGFGVVHTTFFMTQAISLAFLSVAYNKSQETQSSD